MKKSKTFFVCDTCRKEIEENDVSEIEGHPFPYDKGWIFVYRISAKFDHLQIVERLNLHFCSKKCYLKYFENLLVKWKKKQKQEVVR